MAIRKAKPKYILEEIEEAKTSIRTKSSSLKKPKPTDIIKIEDIERSSFILTKAQEKLQDLIQKNILTVVQGPAGTAKTISACYAALKFLAEGRIDGIVITRPIVQSCEQLGYLKGPLVEKIEPYLEAYYSNFEKIVGKETINMLKTLNLIEFKPIAFYRGKTETNKMIILDEAQNVDIQGLMLIATRLGENSKLVICGDVSQHDIKRGDVKLIEFAEMIEGLKDAANFKFEIKDIMRSKFLISLTERYEEHKDKFIKKK